MSSDVSVTVQAVNQVSAPGRKRSEAVQWQACMDDLLSAAAALDTAVGMVIAAAAEREPQPKVVRTCCLAADGVLGGFVGSFVLQQAKAACRSGQCWQPADILSLLSHRTFGHCCLAAVSLLLLLYSGLHLSCSSTCFLQKLYQCCSPSSATAWRDRNKTARRWC